MRSRKEVTTEIQAAGGAALSDRQWWLYLLLCRDGRTYVGITPDIDARFKAHVAGKGARFTRSNPPLKVLATQAYASKSEALKAEAALKRLKGAERRAWARGIGRTDDDQGLN